MKRPWMGLLLLANSALAASPLTLEYGEFYGQMKTAAKGEFAQARLGFFLTDRQSGQRCTVVSGRIDSLDRHQQIEITADAELRLPFDEGLNLDKAKVRLTLPDGAPQCDLSVQVMADLPSASISVAQLLRSQDEMARLLALMAGRVGRYFLPPLRGVQLHMASPRGEAILTTGAGEKRLGWDQGRLSLSGPLLAEFADGSLTPGARTLRVTPWLGAASE